MSSLSNAPMVRPRPTSRQMSLLSQVLMRPFNAMGKSIFSVAPSTTNPIANPRVMLRMIPSDQTRSKFELLTYPGVSLPWSGKSTPKSVIRKNFDSLICCAFQQMFFGCADTALVKTSATRITATCLNIHLRSMNPFILEISCFVNGSPFGAAKLDQEAVAVNDSFKAISELSCRHLPTPRTAVPRHQRYKVSSKRHPRY